MPGGEFDIIREIFAPLASDPGAMALTDDVALAGPYAVTTDMMVEGVHFLKSDPPDFVARKLLRVNISDLAAKGAKPFAYVLSVAWPVAARRADIEAFARGLEEDQAAFRVTLLGGDTTRQRERAAPLTVSATFLGVVARAGIVRRDGAAAGDELWATGTIGDAGLGLAAALQQEKFPPADREQFLARYRLPEPRVAFGGALPGLASAAIDVSDGLIADVGHIARLSGLKAEIAAASIPLSAPAAAWLARQEDKNAAYGRLAAAGDDYEIVFAAPPARRRAVEMAAKLTKTPVARIGALSKGEGVALTAPDGGRIEIAAAGFDHFADA